jgi:cytochrome c-type biogenesis protein CcmH
MDRPASDMTMAEAIGRIEAHLAKEPNDGRGYEVVGPVYMSVGRYDDAVRAFASAARILGETPARLENWGEATVAAADGVVTAEAKALFDRALAGDPKRVKARFYRAVAAEQDGDRATALAVFGDIASETKGTPLSASLAQRIKAMGGTPPEGTLAEAAPQAQQDAGAADPSKTEAGQAVASLPPDERMKMIRGMVDGLSQRLAENGGDVEGWLRLVRSYAVLNEPDKARDALARGRAALASNADGLAKLDALARDLNIGGS